MKAGLHPAAPGAPAEVAKIIRCMSGPIWSVAFLRVCSVLKGAADAHDGSWRVVEGCVAGGTAETGELMTEVCPARVAIVFTERDGSYADVLLSCDLLEAHSDRVPHRAERCGTTMRGGVYVEGVSVVVEWRDVVGVPLSPSIVDTLRGTED